MFASRFLLPASYTKGDWLGLGIDAWALSLDAATVMGLRALRLAAGGAAAQAEANLAVTEKLEAATALHALAVSGRLGATPHEAAARTLRRYKRKVRANRKRLLA